MRPEFSLDIWYSDHDIRLPFLIQLRDALCKKKLMVKCGFHSSISWQTVLEESTDSLIQWKIWKEKNDLLPINIPNFFSFSYSD